MKSTKPVKMKQNHPNVLGLTDFEIEDGFTDVRGKFYTRDQIKAKGAGIFFPSIVPPNHEIDLPMVISSMQLVNAFRATYAATFVLCPCQYQLSILHPGDLLRTRLVYL